MSFLRCSYCGRRCVDGVCHTYWFAPSRGPDVFRVRQRLCVDCVSTNVESLLTPPDAELLTCSACGISVEDDVYAVYVTCYRKGNDPVRGAMALCEPHQIELKARASKGSLELPDRLVDVPDLPVATTPSAPTVYASLGRLDPGLKRRH